MAKQKAKRGVYAMERDVGTTGRESDEAGRTAERATGQGIIREKEAGVRLRLWNGTKKAAITVLCLAGAYFFYIVFQLWRYAD